MEEVEEEEDKFFFFFYVSVDLNEGVVGIFGCKLDTRNTLHLH